MITKKITHDDDTFDINIHIFMDDFLHITMIKMMNKKKTFTFRTLNKNKKKPTTNSKIDLCY